MFYKGKQISVTSRLLSCTPSEKRSTLNGKNVFQREANPFPFRTDPFSEVIKNILSQMFLLKMFLHYRLENGSLRFIEPFCYIQFWRGWPCDSVSFVWPCGSSLRGPFIYCPFGCLSVVFSGCSVALGLSWCGIGSRLLCFSLCVTFELSVMVCLFFLLVSLVGYDLLMWLFLGNFHLILNSDQALCSIGSQRETYLYNFDPLKPHFYIVKLGFTIVYICFLISAQKHRLCVLVRTASPRWL